LNSSDFGALVNQQLYRSSYNLGFWSKRVKPLIPTRKHRKGIVRPQKFCKFQQYVPR
jgi:hypothetical protein